MSVLDVMADRVARGESLGADDARVVLGSYDLIAIGMMGDEVRRRMRGLRTTFVRVFEIRVEALPSSLPSGISAGEFRIVGRPGALDAAEEAVRTARRLAGSVPVTGFALRDLAALAGETRDLRPVFRSLRTAGLDAVAELDVSDEADPSAAVLAAREEGIEVQRLVVRSLASSAEGVVSADAQIASLERARALQERLRGFNAFAPLPRTISVATPTTGYDDVKQIALARLIVTNVESIQVDWSLYGPKLAQVGLTVGADDVDAIAAVDVATLGPRRSALEEIRRNIRAAALEPVERNGLFRAQE